MLGRLFRARSSGHLAGESSESKAPSKPDADSESDDIIVFRTITTLLSKIQQVSLTPQDVNMHTFGLQKRKELKLLNALATVIVMDHEVVAVVANNSHPEGVDILAYAELQPKADSEIPRSSGLLQPLWQLLVNSNPRDKASSATGNIPQIRTPTAPIGAETTLLSYVEKRW